MPPGRHKAGKRRDQDAKHRTDREADPPDRGPAAATRLSHREFGTVGRTEQLLYSLFPIPYSLFLPFLQFLERPRPVVFQEL